ncbi:MAG: hypothetical protein Q8934_23945 [Bacillota bacterium]|nr:hypothetical protein [Bacillota bacterium]
MRTVKGSSISRKTAIGSAVENFLDSNSENISPQLWEDLESLAEEVDELASDLEQRISELEDEE